MTVYEIKINVVVLWTPKSDKNRKLRSIVIVIIEIFVSFVPKKKKKYSYPTLFIICVI